jgi:hypothetical protein
MSLDVAGYLKMARGQTIPPLLLEVVFRSGKSYFIKQVLDHFDAEGLFALRVWDLRALAPEEYPQLLEALNAHPERDAWSGYKTFQSRLDEATLWLHVQDVEQLVEWHDRYWPTRAPESSGEPGPIGFRNPGTLP